MCKVRCKVNGATKVYAILGNPLGHTLSPAMHNAAFAALKMNAVYLALQVEKHNLAEAVKGIRALGIQGGNVTIPFKEAIIPYLDGITEEARLIGAVNTFYWDENGQGLWGDNTDGAGFLVALGEKSPVILQEEQGAVLLGAGGAARAVAVALALAGMKELTIVNRDQARGEVLAARLDKLGMKASVRAWPEKGLQVGLEEELKEDFRKSRLIINTTPLGMSPHEEECPPVDVEWLCQEHLVVDLIYRPKETRLLQKARVRGCQTLNGLPMLLAQGVLSFQRWAGGVAAPVEVMAKELERWV
jgi:shikimate dehydrogenase